jgi:hypothetical protein
MPAIVVTETAQFLPTFIYPDSSDWVDSDNVLTDDDTFAYDTCSRALNYPYGYTSTPTSVLSVYDFTGITAGLAAGDTILGIEVEVRAKSSRSDVDVELSVAYRTETDIGRLVGIAQTATITDEWAVYTFGGLSDIFDSDASADYPAILSSTPIRVSAEMTSGNGSATVSVEYIKMKIWWGDTSCNVFTFTGAANQPLGEWIYSSTATIAGLPSDYDETFEFDTTEVDEEITLIEIEHNHDGRWQANMTGTCQNNDTFRMRRWLKYARSEDEFYEFNALLNVHGVTAGWQVTTVAIDRTNWETISPPDTTGLPLNTWVKTPFTYKIDGVNAIYPAADDSTAFADNMMSWFNSATDVLQQYTDFGTHPYYPDTNPLVRGPYNDTFSYDVYNGTYCEFWAKTSASFNTSRTASPNIGDQGPTWTFTTKIADVIPTQRYFATPAAVVTSTVTTSAAVTMAGIDSTATVTFSTSGGSAHEFKKNAGAWTAVGGGTTVVVTDTITLRMTSSGAGSESSNITMKIGTMHATFCIVTTGGDVTPSAFTFTDVTDAIPGLLYTSNAQVLAGVTAAQPILATVSPGFDIRVGAGAWTASSLSVANGDSITIRGYASLLAQGVSTCVVTIGGTQDTWTLTTRAASSLWS